MSQPKAIVHKISEEEAKQSIETLKVRKDTLEYLRKHKFKTIEDIVKRQERIPKKYRGNIFYALMFGDSTRIDLDTLLNEKETDKT